MIYDNDIQQFYAITHLAALRYYYGHDIRGLKRPPLRMWRKPQMQIVAFDESGTAYHNENYRMLGRWVSMFRYEEHKIIDVDRIYYIMIHELAHASHWEERKNKWHYKTSGKLKESWAVAVGNTLTKDVYPSVDNSSFTSMVTDGKGLYTSVILNLLDSQDESPRGNDYPIDKVEGFKLREVENELKNCGDLTDLRRLLYDHYPTNRTRHHLKTLFDQYKDFTR